MLVPNTLSLEDIYITRRGYTIHHILVSVSVQIYTIYRGFAFRKPDPPFQYYYHIRKFITKLGGYLKKQNFMPIMKYPLKDIKLNEKNVGAPVFITVCKFLEKILMNFFN